MTDNTEYSYENVRDAFSVLGNTKIWDNIKKSFKDSDGNNRNNITIKELKDNDIFKGLTDNQKNSVLLLLSFSSEFAKTPSKRSRTIFQQTDKIEPVDLFSTPSDKKTKTPAQIMKVSLDTDPVYDLNSKNNWIWTVIPDISENKVHQGTQEQINLELNDDNQECTFRKIRADFYLKIRFKNTSKPDGIEMELKDSESEECATKKNTSK